MLKNIGFAAVMLLIPTAAFIGTYLQDTSKETEAKEDALWISEVVNPTIENWRAETRRCEFNWQMDNLPAGVTGVVQLPKIPSSLHDTCFQLAVDKYPLKQRK